MIATGRREMLSVNVSGTSGGSRLARSVSDPLTDFAERGWDLTGWTGVSQGAFMPPNDIVNQFGLVSVDASVALDCAISHAGESVPRPCHP